MVEIKVPKTPRSAFNPNRPPSGLIQAQIQHLEAAAGIYQNSTARRTRVRTEGQAADYIAELTAQIYQRAGAPAEPEIAMPQPPAPIAGTATPTSTTRRRTAPAAGSAKPAKRRKKPAAAKRRASTTNAGGKPGRLGRSSRASSAGRKRGARKSSKRAGRRKGRA